MINFWFFEIQKSDLLLWILWTHQKYNGKFRVPICFFFKRQQSNVFLTQIHIHNSFIFSFYQIHSRLIAKSNLIIGQRCEIMLDIIGAFWEIWLDIVLNTSFFEVFRESFRIKITLDYWQKISIWCLIL